MNQFNLHLNDEQKVKLNMISEWFDISKSKILKEGIDHRWDEWSEIMKKYPSYIDYLNR